MKITLPTIPSSLEKVIGKAFKSFERACDNISRSLTLVGYALSAYLIMTGVSKLMDSRYKRLTPPPPQKNDDDNCTGGDDTEQKKKDGRNKEKCISDIDPDTKDEVTVKARKVGGTAAADTSYGDAEQVTNSFGPAPTSRSGISYGTTHVQHDPTPSYANIYNIPP